MLQRAVELVPLRRRSSSRYALTCLARVLEHLFAREHGLEMSSCMEPTRTIASSGGHLELGQRRKLAVKANVTASLRLGRG
jgi:hypothetical protein